MPQAKRKTKPMPTPENASAEINKLLSRIPDGRSAMGNFELFVEACNIAIDEFPEFIRRPVEVGASGALPFLAASEAWCKARLDKISQTCYQVFAEGFAILLASSVDKDGTPTYRDVIGPVYMELLSGSRWNNDQFYTPGCVAEFMAQITIHDTDVIKEFRDRSMAVINEDPILQAMLLAVSFTAQACEGEEFKLFVEKLWPFLKPKVKPLTILDPCCGSGVLLLAAAKAIPRWLIDIGFVEFYGMDIQHIAVRMAQLNCKLYGLGSRTAA